MRAARLLPAALALAAGLVSVTPASGCACGIAIEADIAYEEALLSWDGRRETLTVKLDLEHARESAAVLFPVPAEPEVGQVRARSDLFAYLERATRPPAPELEGDGEGAAAPRGGVDVVERRVIGAFDVAVLRAGDEGALVRWLRDNRYTVPAEAEPILDGYVDRAWHFVAVKLAERGDGSLKPLRISFPARRPVYPMELSRASRVPVSLRLYVNSRGPVDSTGIRGMRRVFDSPVDELEPAPPADLGPLLPQRHLTRLELSRAPPPSIDADVGIRAASIAPEDGSSALLWIGLGVGSLAALGGLIAWRRRQKGWK